MRLPSYLRGEILSILWDIETHDELLCTQSFCLDYAAQGRAEGFVVRALSQTQGKGRHGKDWLFEKGNLAFSFILRPECEIAVIGQISILTGVALGQSVFQFSSAPFCLKWPNDVLLDQKKCAGILINNELSGSDVASLVIGVGVNTFSAPDGFACVNVDADAFLYEFLMRFNHLYSHWKSQGFEDIRRFWLENTYEKGTGLNVGAFEDLDEFGNLIVRDAQNQLKVISAGDVYLSEDHYAAGN